LELTKKGIVNLYVYLKRWMTTKAPSLSIYPSCILFHV